MAARRAYLTACSINGLTNTGSRLATVVLATLVVILNASSVHASGQRCYMCGPVSVDWFLKIGVTPCDRFRPIPEYEMDCGPGYDYCAVFYNHNMMAESRACTQKLSENCVAKGDGLYKNVYTVCSCNGTLCNNKSMEFPKITLIPNEKMFNPTTENSNQSIQEVDVTTMKHDSVTEDQENEKEETTEKLEEKKESNESEEEMKINKTKELNTKAERAVPNTTEEHKNDIASGHALPLPEALGQEHNKKPAQQGAPVDDEEDTSEGSGSRIETDNKSHHPTTTHITYLEIETTTTESSKNDAACFHSSVVISFGIWTTVARIIFA